MSIESFLKKKQKQYCRSFNHHNAFSTIYICWLNRWEVWNYAWGHAKTCIVKCILLCCLYKQLYWYVEKHICGSHEGNYWNMCLNLPLVFKSNTICTATALNMKMFHQTDTQLYRLHAHLNTCSVTKSRWMTMNWKDTKQRATAVR